MQTGSDIEEFEPSESLTSPETLAELSNFGDSINVRVGLAVYGILLPIVCHFMTLGGPPEPARWQSGEWEAKLSFVLSGECGWPVFPLLIFAMICMAIVIYNETIAFSKAWVRLGIFSGVIICGWYLFAFSSTVFKSPFVSFGLLLGAAMWLVTVHGVIWMLIFSLKSFDLAPIILICGFIILLLAAFVGGNGAMIIFVAPFSILLLLSTPLAFLAYLGMSIRILNQHAAARRFTLSQLMMWVTWFAAFVSAIQTTIKLSYAKYAQLPLEAPEDCYVATAASKGHPLIVGSQNLPTTTDQLMTVNQQLTIFKAAELALRAISPKAHLWFRFGYDRIGPLAAARLRSPLSATAAYLCLKPAEWLCRIVLRILLGRQTYKLAKQLYLARAEAVAGQVRK